MKGILERLSIYFGVLVALIVLYVGLMTLTFSYSSKNFESRIAVANAIKEDEGDYPVPSYFKGGAMLDNFTDFLMIGKIMGDEDESALYQAMSVAGYERYWHGYLVWLRVKGLADGRLNGSNLPSSRSDNHRPSRPIFAICEVFF